MHSFWVCGRNMRDLAEHQSLDPSIRHANFLQNHTYSHLGCNSRIWWTESRTVYCTRVTDIISSVSLITRANMQAYIREPCIEGCPRCLRLEPLLSTSFGREKFALACSACP